MAGLAPIVSTLLIVVGLLTQELTPPGPAASDDFSPLLFVMFLAALAVCLVLLGIGIVLALAGIVCTMILAALGIVASSAVAALLRRRVATGVRAFHYQACAALAAPAGVMLLWSASALCNLQMSPRSVLPLGLLAGCVTGLTVAGVFDWAARLAYHRLLPTPGTDAAPTVPLPG